jgi:uncharacterized membrane protein YfcA
VTALADLAIAGAGLAAGTVNAVVGTGSLITFPTLVGLGYSPLVANVSNNVGLVPGNISAAIGYRSQLGGQRDRALVLGSASAAGGLAGGTLLLLYPSTFETVVPWLVLLAVTMVIVQPRLSVLLASRSEDGKGRLSWPLRGAVALTGVYGGYFGAAQGVLLIGVLGIGLGDRLQRINGLKNVLVGVVNGVAAVLFMIFGPVAWVPAVILAASSTVGGQLGARVGLRLNPLVLRGVIVVAGLAVAIKLLV